MIVFNVFSGTKQEPNYYKVGMSETLNLDISVERFEDKSIFINRGTGSIVNLTLTGTGQSNISVYLSEGIDSTLIVNGETLSGEVDFIRFSDGTTLQQYKIVEA